MSLEFKELVADIDAVGLGIIESEVCGDTEEKGKSTANVVEGVKG